MLLARLDSALVLVFDCMQQIPLCFVIPAVVIVESLGLSLISTGIEQLKQRRCLLPLLEDGAADMV